MQQLILSFNNWCCVTVFFLLILISQILTTSFASLCFLVRQRCFCFCSYCYLYLYLYSWSCFYFYFDVNFFRNVLFHFSCNWIKGSNWHLTYWLTVISGKSENKVIGWMEVQFIHLNSIMTLVQKGIPILILLIEELRQTKLLIDLTWTNKKVIFSQ